MTYSRVLQCDLNEEVAQRPGLLWRVGHMFAERAINIDQISVHRTDSKRGAAMVVCFNANDKQLAQIMRRFDRFEGVLDLKLMQSGQLTVKCN